MKRRVVVEGYFVDMKKRFEAWETISGEGHYVKLILPTETIVWEVLWLKKTKLTTGKENAPRNTTTGRPSPITSREFGRGKESMNDGKKAEGGNIQGHL